MLPHPCSATVALYPVVTDFTYLFKEDGGQPRQLRASFYTVFKDFREPVLYPYLTFSSQKANQIHCVFGGGGWP